ncbi:MAG TPA: acetyl-CoA carboxylase biotin carboxylase subunit [Vicinamibacterales bacterium]|nr:acetyl-CoA carboxylase biotin carboxylase subunit [Vicinamibacterales bacterium]
MRKILIANRGEIAVRIVRACRDLGLASVAVYSDADRGARHVRMADEACHLGPSPASESYLRVDRILDAVRASGADAVHPGYGFLSENAAFAAACRDAGVTFIGPSADAIELMGSKTAARGAAIAAGVPVVPGTKNFIPVTASAADIAAAAAEIGYPVMVKAVAGGGGKGMRTVGVPEELPGAIRAARSEAGAAFGDSAIYLEQRLERPRHVEVQLLADHHGTVLPFVERECSIQRRHQKLLEETPSPSVSPELRARLAGAAAAVAGAAGYTNAGTIEFLLDERGRFYFLEMNTRLQVEHPITEAVTGVDLVEWQIRIARGERLSLDAGEVLTPRGHAIECRIYAEDADAGFLPSPGPVAALRVPAGPGIRDDGSADAGGEVPIDYDPLISKLIAWGQDRAQAIARMRRALREYEVLGIRTTVPFFTWLLRQPAFDAGAFHTGYLDELLHQRQGRPFSEQDLSLEEVAAMALALELGTRTAGGDSTRSRSRVNDPSGSSLVGMDAGSQGRGAGGWKRRARIDALRH